MKKNREVFLRSLEEGFTYLEVLAAISIISFSGFIIWNGVNGAINATGKVLEKSRVTTELTLFEYNIRNAVKELKIAYWDNEIDVEKLEELTDKIENTELEYIHLESIETSPTGVIVNISDNRAVDYRIKVNFSSFILAGNE